MNAPLRNLWLRLLAIAIVGGFGAPHARASVGVFAALFLYNLFLCLSIRSYSNLYYVLYLLVACPAVTSLNGFGSSTLYPSLTWPGN